MRSPKISQGPGGYRPSVFMGNYPLEDYQYIAGIDESRDEKHLIYFTRRRMFAYTDQSDGITYRKGSIATDGLGFGQLQLPQIQSGPSIQRGMGIFQSGFSNKNFLNFFAVKITGFPFTRLNIEPGIGDLTSITNTALNSNSNFGGNITGPFPTLSSVCNLNNYDIYTDGVSNVRINSSTVGGNITLNYTGFSISNNAYTSGVLNGFYGYCVTLADANNNESEPSYFQAVPQATNNTINLSISLPTGEYLSVAGWSTIRVYRTLTAASAQSASQNPTMALVSSINIVFGTQNYSFADNNTDASITQGINPNTGLNPVYLTNVNYNQQISVIGKYCSTFQNRLFLANVNATYNVNGVNTNLPFSPNRIYFSDFTDNTLQANGNATSFNQNNFIDLDTTDGFPIIGMFTGLGGRLFVFKENGTWIISPTGSTTTNAQGQIIAPFQSTKINNEYGMYHHSISEIGGSIYGMTKDGIASFNGSTYKILSMQIRETLKYCIEHEADSGIYDFISQRYYLAVCDSRLSGSYGISDTSIGNGINIYPGFRNTVLVFDAASGTWEIHKNQFLQTFGKIKDSYGKQRIFAQGMCGDVYTFLSGQISGPCYSAFATITSDIVLTVAGQSFPSGLVGKKLYIAYLYDSSGTMAFSNYVGTIKATTSTTLTMDTPLPSGISQALIFIDNAYGTNTGTGSTLTDTSNYFDTTIVTGSAALIDPANVANDAYATVSSNSNTSLTLGSGIAVNGYNYVLMPYQYINTLANTQNYQTPRWLFLTPPIGDMQGGQKKKKFNQLKLEIKGTGTLRVRIFLNGQGVNQNNYYLSVPDQTIYSPIPSQAATGFWPYYIRLRGAVANYIRAEISMVRGAGAFEITSFGARMRLLGEMRNA